MANSQNAGRFVLRRCVLFVLVLAVVAVVHGTSETRSKKLPNHLIPRRSSQVHDGFGINSDLPRDPYIPWTRWWWTRIFDAGMSFIRIGQYENSSDYTSWDWVERKRGEYSIPAEVDDEVNSLVENGVHIEIQLLYGNPMYTSPAEHHAGAWRFSQSGPKRVLGVLAAQDAGADRSVLEVRELDRQAFPRAGAILRGLERTQHRLLESSAQCGGIWAGVQSGCSRDSRSGSERQSYFWCSGWRGSEFCQGGAGCLRLRGQHRHIRVSHLSQLRA